MLKIQIMKHDPELILPERIAVGDWVDLRSAEEVQLLPGEFRLISLGISVKLPSGYEANIVPRSSTFIRWGILQTNSYGVIDASYSGPDDIWKFPAYATKNTIIHKNDRICQFRINAVQPHIEFEEVELNGDNRGGFGSTGTN